MDQIDKDIAAYEKLQNGLEKESLNRWVVLHQTKLIGVFDSFEEAAEAARLKFGAGPYLIRQVGVDSVSLPTYVASR